MAVNSFGESALSTEAANTPRPIPAPASVTVGQGDTQLTITWDTNIEADSYNIYWSTTSGTGTGGTPVSNVSSPYAHKGITNGIAYYYVVTANNAIRESVPSVEASGTPNLIPISGLTLPDENLAACVTGSGVVNVSNLTSLTCSSQGINDISGIDALTSLTQLNLYGNSITDLSALASLTSLTRLYLESNSITDLSALASLTSLTYLSLQSNSITDVSVLASLTSLTQLYLGGNSIVDISVLALLTSLTSLNLFNNNITDVSVLASLTSLTDLYLYSNSITDISALASLTSLTYLYLFNNSITTGVAGLTALTSANYINLRGNPNIPCADVGTLDDTLDGDGSPNSGNGGGSGIVRWNQCI